MATGQTLINRAQRLIGCASPTTDESNDGLVALNAMIASWQIEKINVFAYLDTAFNLAATVNSYTVGPSGNFALTPRPSKIEQIFVRAGSINYEIELIDFEKWNRIPDQTSTSDIPLKAYYEPTLPTGTLKVWPVPTTVYALHIVTWTSLSELAALSTTIVLPQGYERALTYNLAIEVASEFGQQPSKSVIAIAAESKAAIKRMNQRPMLATPDLWGTIQGQRSNIYSGGYVS